MTLNSYFTFLSAPTLVIIFICPYRSSPIPVSVIELNPTSSVLELFKKYCPFWRIPGPYSYKTHNRWYRRCSDLFKFTYFSCRRSYLLYPYNRYLIGGIPIYFKKSVLFTDIHIYRFPQIGSCRFQFTSRFNLLGSYISCILYLLLYSLLLTSLTTILLNQATLKLIRSTSYFLTLFLLTFYLPSSGLLFNSPTN